jgi:hypothetical protein
MAAFTAVRETANEIGATRTIKSFVWVVVLGVVGYSEVLYLGIVGTLFPAGVMYAACVLGAFATGISVLCLYAGKTHWFRPGSQLIAAWFFTGLEIVVLIMNDILAMAIHNGSQLDQYLSYYRFIAPSVPVLALIGWGVLLYLDPARKIKHARMEMEDRRQAQELEFEEAQFEAQMKLRYKALEIMQQQLEAEVETSASIAHIQAGATRATASAIQQLTGIAVPQQLTPRALNVNYPSGTLHQAIDDYQLGAGQQTEPLAVQGPAAGGEKKSKK